MNRRGFTLVEILAVIIVLGFLIALIVPVVNNLLGDSEDVLENEQINMVINATKKYMIENSELLPDYGKTICVNIDDLINNGVIDNDVVIDPKTKEEMDGCVSVIYDQTYNQYVYNYDPEGIGEIIMDSNEFEFDYTGGEQIFRVPRNGYYKLEVWGAQGGSGDSQGGYGGYSQGIISLNKGEKLFINVGGEGSGTLSSEVLGGYNGGGNSKYSTNYSGEMFASGGGATHIAKKSGVLSTLEKYKGEYDDTLGTYNSEDIIIVAGGGGGAGWGDYGNFQGGSAGGFQGVQSNYYSSYVSGGGATQDSGGTAGTGALPGTFGQGGSSNSEKTSGGGGGFHGGGGVSSGNAPGGGGSGYIGNSSLIDKSMYCYNCDRSSANSTKTVSTTSISENAVSRYAKKGNGYAKITYLGSTYDEPYDDVFYSNGTVYENLYTLNTWQVDQSQFLSDSIYLKSGGYYVVYTDVIDLSLYNTVILKKTNLSGGRCGFMQYPNQVNNGGTHVGVTWQNLDTNLYAADISSLTNTNLRFYNDAWNGDNSGYIYYIAFSKKTIDEVKSDYSFVE